MSSTTKAWLYLFIIVSTVALPISLMYAPNELSADVMDIIKSTSASLLTLVGFIIRDMRNRDNDNKNDR